MGTLYIIATPIGNMEDITLRGLRLLREVDLIAAEDTRHTRRLLTYHHITTPCQSYHEHNKRSRIDDILTALAGGNVALVSDAGTPTLSDPGYELVNACIEAGFTVSPIPGASAPIAALAASGLPTDRFHYLGFLPPRSNKRRNTLERIADIPATLICFEAPHRLVASLSDMLAVLGNRRIVLARELTKVYEELVRLPLSEALEHCKAQRPRGEYTLVIEGARQRRPPPDRMPRSEHQSAEETPATCPDDTEPDAAAIQQRLQQLYAQGERSSRAARIVAKEMGLSRGFVYQIGLQMEEEETEEEETEEEETEEEETEEDKT